MGDARVYTGCSNRGRGMPRREFGEHGKGGGRPGVSAPGRISPTPHAPCRNRLMGKLKPPGTPLATLRCQLWHDVKIPWPAEATTGTGRAWKRGGRPGVSAPGRISPTPHAPCRNRLMGKLKPPGTPLATLRCQLWHDVKIPWPADATTGTVRAWKRGDVLVIKFVLRFSPKL